jgi:predicted DNA-binding transcriptional regulator AlpA
MSIEILNSDGEQDPTRGRPQLLRDAEVRKRTNIGKTKRRALILAKSFPAPIKLLNEHQLPGRTSYWLSCDIDLWLEQQVAAHRERIKKISNNGLNGWPKAVPPKKDGDRE